MTDDKDLSHLISQSLQGSLEDKDSQALESHLQDSPSARKFAELSRSIQNSAIFGADQAAADEAGEGDEPSLSQDVKEKMKASVSGAIEEKLRLSQAGLIATNDIASLSKSTRTPLESGADDTILRSTVRFKRTKKIGEGGLGIVWLAQDQRLNRMVAIKQLKDVTLESPAARSRFHREAAITGRLEHPNIVPLYFYGDERGSGAPFYSMRFVGKRTLAQAIEEHHDRVEAGQADRILGMHRLLSAFLDVCQAIAYAHSRGVVHRDLKPDNIALDNFGQVIVLDWGLAKLLEDGELMQQITISSCENDGLLGSTMANDVVGTPLYMAPEQARGDHDVVNRSTDVYGLGAVLFAILTGQAAHEETIRQNKDATIKEVLGIIADRNAPDVLEAKPDTPKELSAICRRAMDPKQHLRYESVDDLAAAVERWMAGQNEKQSQYDSVRMEGRELRSHLQSVVNDLERNVRFMSSLPPIPEIIVAAEDDELQTWRERLATIFRGLLRANSNYGSVSYLKIKDNEFSEIVRVERHSSHNYEVRSVPRSRLKSGPATEYMKSVINEYPGDVLTSLACDDSCAHSAGCANEVGLFAGTPVFDGRSEEVFGLVVIGCDINSALSEQLSSTRFTASEVVVACDTFHVMAHLKDGALEPAKNEPVADRAPHFLPAVEALQTQLEFFDEHNSEVYGCRIWFVDRPDHKHGIIYLLRS